MAAPRWARAAVIAATLAWMAAIGWSQVPPQDGPDTIGDRYAAKVVVNDVSDMYTRRRLEQTPLEAATWSKEASGAYPPAMLLSFAALYMLGEAAGIGFYGAMLLVVALFLGLSLAYCWRTRWYVFPLLYGNFFYFGYRFFAVQDDSYLVMLTTIMAALMVVPRLPALAHALMALAIALKLSPLYYAKYVARMGRPTAVVFVGIVLAGLLLPVLLWENYLSLYRYHSEYKGSLPETMGGLAVAAIFTLVLSYVEERLDFDWEDRIGWSVVPFALYLAFSMNTARHLLIVLLIPDKRGVRSLALALGMLAPTLFPQWVRFNSSLAITTALLAAALVSYLDAIGWDRVRADLRRATIRGLLPRRDGRVADSRR